MKRLVTVFFVLVAGITAAAQNTAAKHPFTFEDMMKLKRVNEPVPSPDGKWVVFSAVDVDLAANTKTPHIWIVPADGSAKERLLISTPQGEDRPRWSPDGRYLSFTASYDGSQQIWMASFDTRNGRLQRLAPRAKEEAEKEFVRQNGATADFIDHFPLAYEETIKRPPSKQEAWGEKMTSISTEADGQLWSPDGKNILFVSAVYPDCDRAADQDACNKLEDDKREKLTVKAQIFTHLLYRHWKTYSTAKRSHLFVQPVNADGIPNGKAYDITPGDHDVPPFSLGGADMYSWSPESKEVAYTSNIDEVEATSTNNEVFLVELPQSSGTSSRAESSSPQAGETESRDPHFSKAKKISASPGSDSTPRYSPDGKYIAYLSQARAGYESDRFRLMLYERATGKITDLTKGFDRWVDGFTWANDSNAIYFTAENQGSKPLYGILLSTQKVYGPSTAMAMVGGDYGDPIVGRDGSIFMSLMTSEQPSEIHRSERLNGDCDVEFMCQMFSKPLTAINKSRLDAIQLHKPEPFWFTGAAQTKVQGFIVKPPNFDANKKYPVKFLIHGGPQGAWGDSWSYRWNAQLFAANGYVVVMINPRGSTGYGQKFIDEINGDWGGKPITDLMLGLDYAIKKYPFIDGNRVCAMGASWGGYAVDWLIGHTNRFKCAVTHDGMFNTVSAYGTTEELWFPQWEFRGTPYTTAGRANYERFNPLNSVKNFKTPTLVSHGQLDFRLDVSEGFQLFTALQKQKVPSKMMYFPDEGHWVLKPQNSQFWYKTVNAWVDQWTGEKK